MRQFPSIQKLDTAILYTLELASSLSVPLLAFGLIASMANVLTKGSVLTNNQPMQELWAWTQCIGIDASVPGTVMRTFHYYKQREWVCAGLYTFLSLLLLFTAAIVSNIEAIQQTLSISLDTAYIHVFVPVEALIWIRSIAIVLLIVAHAVRHLGRTVDVAVKTAKPKLVKVELAQPVPPAHEECASQILPAPVNKNFLRVKEYLSHHPDASARTVAQALGMSATTANKWMQKARNTA